MKNNFEYMSENDFEDIKRIFYTQSYEILETLQELLAGLEDSTGDDALKNIKRHIHTLKGDSNSFGLTSIGAICHGMEDVLSSLPEGAENNDRAAVDLLLECVDTIGSLLSESESDGLGADTTAIHQKIKTFLPHNDADSAADKSGHSHEAYHTPYTEYQELQSRDALERGLHVFEMDMIFHPMCIEKSAAAFMVLQRLSSLGQVIRSVPDADGSDIDGAEKMSLLFCTGLASDEVIRDASIPGITSEIIVRDYLPTEKKCRAKDFRLDGRTNGIKGQMLMIESSKVDRVMNLVGELIIGRSMIDHIAGDVAGGASSAEIASRLIAATSYMDRTVSDIQSSVMKMRMVQVNQVFRKFPKIVRALSAEKRKKVRLEIRGRETELDKAVVDALGEPLAHIIRNLIDHGIESPQERAAIGKNEEGTITLTAFHEATQIVIEASDDGGGIDTAAVKKKAVEEGHLRADDAERLSEDDSLNLIFLPGLSTSATVSDISGRGVGMAAVKSAIDTLKGSIDIESTPGKGTTFRLRLPLTLAVIKAMLFEAGGKLYALPVSAISEVARIRPAEVVTVDGKDMLILRDRIISLIHLDGLLGIGRRENDKKFILILDIGGRNMGLVTDCLVGQQDLVMKAVDSDHARSDSVAGASLLGDGRVVLVLDAPALIKKAIEYEKKRMVKI